MKVKFIESVTVPATKFGPGLHFKKGSVHDLSEPSAYRWVRRNVAVYVVEEAAPTLKIGRPMMGERVPVAAQVDIQGIAEPAKPKKAGRPKKGA